MLTYSWPSGSAAEKPDPAQTKSGIACAEVKISGQARSGDGKPPPELNDLLRTALGTELSDMASPDDANGFQQSYDGSLDELNRMLQHPYRPSARTSLG